MDSDPLDMRALCAVCGADMWPCNSRKIYCSARCKSIDRRNLERQALAEFNAARRCARCGGPMRPLTRRDAIYCGRACANAGPHYYRGTRACGWCGAEFRAVNKGQRTCSISCGQKLRQSRAKG